jgi:hypothetical protein
MTNLLITHPNPSEKIEIVKTVGWFTTVRPARTLSIRTKLG